MKFLLIGGAGFIGSQLLPLLTGEGHQVAVFHRTRKSLPSAVEQITGDRNNLADYRNDFRRNAPDVVVDLILSNGSQARELMDVFRGMAGRALALSSGDVYRATAVLHSLDSGPLQAMPLTEESDLRTSKNMYGPETLDRLRHVFAWLGNEYDKIPVEEAVLSDPALPGTVLRLPMIYGPGDPLHRLFPYLKRMEDRRPFILLDEQAASWRGPRGYVADLAVAIALAATSDTAAGRIYNVAEEHAYTEREWVERIGHAMGWRGEVIEVPFDRMPDHLKLPGNYKQHWIMSSARIRGELGFRESASAESALEKTIAWERANPPAVDPAQFNYAAEDAARAIN